MGCYWWVGVDLVMVVFVGDLCGCGLVFDGWFWWLMGRGGLF